MLATVEFNDERMGNADEISHISPKGMLASKLERSKSTAAQRTPQQAFDIG